MSTHIFVADQADSLIQEDGAKVGFQFPATRVEWQYKYVTWQLAVFRILGTPTTWSLRARFLEVLEHSTGPQFSTPIMLPFTELETGTYVREGIGLYSPETQASSIAAALAANPGASPEEVEDINEMYAPPASAGDWGLIANETSGLTNTSPSTPILVTRTVENFTMRHKVELEFTQAGGTGVPAVAMVVLAHEHD